MDDSVVVTIVIQSIAFAIGLFKIYSDVQMRLRELDLRMQAVEKQDDELFNKFDRIMDAIQEIKLELKDKQNR